jgi:MFS family permease
MLGAATNGFMQDRFGRKPMFFVGGAISALGQFVSNISGYQLIPSI